MRKEKSIDLFTQPPLHISIHNNGQCEQKLESIRTADTHTHRDNIARLKTCQTASVLCCCTSLPPSLQDVPFSSLNRRLAFGLECVEFSASWQSLGECVWLEGRARERERERRGERDPRAGINLLVPWLHLSLSHSLSLSLSVTATIKAQLYPNLNFRFLYKKKERPGRERGGETRGTVWRIKGPSWTS